MRYFLGILFALSLLGSAQAQTADVHGQGVALSVTIVPGMDGVPLAAITGTIDGKPVAGIGWLRRLPGDRWVCGFLIPPLPLDGDAAQKQTDKKPQSQGQATKPWHAELDMKPSNGDKPGDQPAGEIRNPNGNTRKLYN